MASTDFQSLLSSPNVKCFANLSPGEWMAIKLALLQRIAISICPVIIGPEASWTQQSGGDQSWYFYPFTVSQGEVYVVTALPAAPQGAQVVTAQDSGQNPAGTTLCNMSTSTTQCSFTAPFTGAVYLYMQTGGSVINVSAWFLISGCQATDYQSLLSMPNVACYASMPPGILPSLKAALLQLILLNGPSGGGGGGGGGGTWTPATPIPGTTLIEWLKGDTLTGGSGAQISDWPATVGKDATQTPSSGANPTVLIGTYFYPAARFNGTSDLLSLSGVGSQVQPVTLAMFFSYKGGAVTSTFLGMGPAGGPATIGTAGGQFTASAGVSANIQATDSSAHILVIVFNGASSKYAFDGGALTTVNLGTDNVNLASIGAGNNLANYSQVDVGELLMWSGDASGGYTNIFNYLADRWLIT
jgi:hypothetical protein